MDGIYWLAAAVLFSLYQSRSLLGDRRRLIETWLRNLLGIAVGVRCLAGSLMLIVLFQQHSLPGASLAELFNFLGLYVGLAAGGLLCLYRKIFWFGTSVIFSIWGLITSSSVVAVSIQEGASVLTIVSEVIGGLISPLAILVLMGIYYFQYVRVAR